MCEQCMAETDLWENVLPGWHLVRANKDGRVMEKGDWGLVIQNDPTFVFETTPIKDPTAKMTDKEIDALPKDSPLHDRAELFLETSRKIMIEMNEYLSLEYPIEDFPCVPLNVWSELYKAIEAAGYKKETYSDAAYWLCNYLAEYLEQHLEPNYPYRS